MMKRRLGKLVSCKGDLGRIALISWFAITMIALTAQAEEDEPWRSIKIGSLDLHDAHLRRVVDELAEKANLSIHLFGEFGQAKGSRKLTTIRLEADKDGTLGVAIDGLLEEFPGSKVITSKQGIVLVLYSDTRTDEFFSHVWKDVLFDGTFEEFIEKFIRPEGCDYCGPAGVDKMRVRIRFDGSITRRELLVRAAESCRIQARILFDPVPRGLTIQTLDATLTKVLSETQTKPVRFMTFGFKRRYKK